MLAPAFHGNLEIASSQRPVENTGRNLQSLLATGLGTKTLASVELQGLPRAKSFRHVLGKSIRVTGLTKGERSDVSHELMVAVPILGCTGESRNDNEGSIRADCTNEIGQNSLFSPLLSRFDLGLTKSKIEGTREELLSSVESPGLQKLLGADDTEPFE